MKKLLSIYRGQVYHTEFINKIKNFNEYEI